MSRNEAISMLTLIANAFGKMYGCDDEAEAIRMAIYDMGIVEQVKAERDAALQKLKDIIVGEEYG